MNISEGGSDSQDFDLNLAPIIDCFTVLITYLLVSASFLNLSILDVGVAANGEATPALEQQPTDTPINIEVSITATRSAAIKIIGGPQNLDLTIPIDPSSAGGVDLPLLLSKINEAKEKYPSVQDVSVTAEPAVKYKELIKVIENLKKAMPKVYISG